MPTKANKASALQVGAETPSVATWGSLVKALEIDEVVAESVACVVNHDRMKKARGGGRRVRAALQHETVSISEKSVVFRFNLEVDTLDAKPRGEDRLLSVRMVYRSIYDLGLEEAPSEADVERYRRTLGVLHVLPFLRAHVADLTMRAGLPPFLLPLYRTDHEEGQNRPGS